MLWNLLSNSSEADVDNTGTIIFFVVMIALIVLFMFWNRKSQKKREAEINATLDAIQPGNKVKTIGGICGIVVEVCPDDGTFVLETGSEASGKSYIKLDRKSVYQTDAVAKTEAPVEEPAEETAETPVEETVEEPVFVEETPVEVTEEVTEEATEEVTEEVTEEPAAEESAE